MSKVIKGGAIVTADRQWKADVLIEGEHIAEIGENLNGDPVDARYLLPLGPAGGDGASRLLDGAGIEKSVYIQVNWAPEAYEREVAWVSEIARETGWPHAIIGYADFMADDVRPQLDALAKYPLMRGIRMQIHWHENEMYRFADRPDLATDPRFDNRDKRVARDAELMPIVRAELMSNAFNSAPVGVRVSAGVATPVG